jgi:subtilisin family serine protease
MAPGAMLVAPRSSYAITRPAEQISPSLRVMAGTSMATPYITGIVALLLEKNPLHTPATIKQWLFARCTLVNATGPWDPKQGYGLIQL